MGSDVGYVLGLDGLPRGTVAVVAAAGSVIAEFDLGHGGGSPLPLDARVAEARRRAVELTGTEPAEVRLVCFDDGDDGSNLRDIATGLAELGIRFEVLGADPEVEVRPDDTGSESATGSSRVERSRHRARAAALSA